MQNVQFVQSVLSVKFVLSVHTVKTMQSVQSAQNAKNILPTYFAHILSLHFTPKFHSQFHKFNGIHM